MNRLHWRIWALGLGAVLCLGCSQNKGPEQGSSGDSTAAVTPHYAKDGTRFETAVGSASALPPFFPEHLLMPKSTLLSSGQIQDRAGGVASVLVQTSAPVTEVVEHYREDLWFRHWDLLSEAIQEDNYLMTFEYTHPKAERYQQVVVQIYPTQPNIHEVLVLLSYETPSDTWRDYPPTPKPGSLEDPGHPSLAETAADPVTSNELL